MPGLFQQQQAGRVEPRESLQVHIMKGREGTPRCLSSAKIVKQASELTIVGFKSILKSRRKESGRWVEGQGWGGEVNQAARGLVRMRATAHLTRGSGVSAGIGSRRPGRRCGELRGWGVAGGGLEVPVLHLIQSTVYGLDSGCSVGLRKSPCIIVWEHGGDM